MYDPYSIVKLQWFDWLHRKLHEIKADSKLALFWSPKPFSEISNTVGHSMYISGRRIMIIPQEFMYNSQIYIFKKFFNIASALKINYRSWKKGKKCKWDPYFPHTKTSRTQRMTPKDAIEIFSTTELSLSLSANWLKLAGNSTDLRNQVFEYSERI